jgi:hypothetical protein
MALALALGVAPQVASARTVSGTRSKSSGPTVSIVSPTSGATVSGAVTVAGSAADSGTVTAVTVAVDSGAAQAATGTTSWSYTLNTATLAAGTHTLTARATDSAGLSTSAGISISVVPPAPPTISISSPAQGAAASGWLSVAGTASSGAAIGSVAVQLDDGALTTAAGTASWSVAINTAAVSDGPHALTAWVTDSAGRTAVSGLQVQVHNTPACSPSATSATLGGTVFEDINRNGVVDSGDTVLSGVTVYFFDATGANVGHATTDATGTYSSAGLAAGRYSVELDPSWWPSMQPDWLPDTTGSLSDTATTCASGTTTVNLGLRPIVRSTDSTSPITSFTGPDGLTVQSYDDVASARLLFDELMTGSLVGAEAAHETIRFDLMSTTTTSSSCTAVNGVYTACTSISYIGLVPWLDEGDFPLFFEYGNHWNVYYTYIDHAASWNDYYVERGVAGNPSLGTSQAWSDEMLTDDWRQLFGSPTAQAVAPLNGSIAPAAQVSGLATWLATTYRGQ